VRIAVVNNFYPPRVGGSSHLADSLAVGYAARGHRVLVVTAAYRDAPTFEERDGIQIVRLPAFQIPETRFALSFDISFATRLSLPRRLARLLDKFDPDVIHQHGQFFDLTWASGLYARRRKIPTLLSVHTRLENPAALYSGLLGLLDRFMVFPFLRAYRPAMVVMDRMMDGYIRRRYAGAYSSLVPIPVGISPAAAQSGDAARGRAEAWIEPGGPVIVSLGHVIPLRDRVALVEALPAVLRAVPNAKVVVVGNVYYDAFRKRAAELGVAHAIRAIGAVPKAEVPDYLAMAGVECHEQGYGMGTATLEAMAAGVPVVAMATPDNFPTVPLHDGEDVYLCPPGDIGALAERLIEVLRDPAAARAVGQRGQRLVEQHFTLDVVTEEYLAVLRQLVGPREPNGV
jgi:glycosyltransferase involved in cell wall biosynthesis